MLSKDNIELQFATNHIGQFLLTNLLLETMKKTACESRTEGRIVNVSSRRHKFSYPEGIRFDKINEKMGCNFLSAYGQSKLANIMHANELAKRLKEDGLNITANSVSPGPINTNIFRHFSFLSGMPLTQSLTMLFASKFYDLEENFDQPFQRNCNLCDGIYTSGSSDSM
ncbi:hypothetical protein Ddye_013772 [Dipteronia dyeriana]|uniref:Short-chain dehydrogenase n=1 Tax=Dipteronia dyeriana TaxID=168575 RepID=A0AAD9X740_9ROSI|nr:hypothetical protein Ddye_013772 [Dipteronia dyeriana]